MRLRPKIFLTLPVLLQFILYTLQPLCIILVWYPIIHLTLTPHTALHPVTAFDPLPTDIPTTIPILTYTPNPPSTSLPLQLSLVTLPPTIFLCIYHSFQNNLIHVDCTPNLPLPCISQHNQLAQLPPTDLLTPGQNHPILLFTFRGGLARRARLG